MEKKGKQIFSKTVRASKLTWQGTLHCRYTTLTSIVAAVDSICKKRQKTCLIHGELTGANKLLCVSSQKGELFKLSTFSFQSLMLKLTKKLKLWFENTVKIQLLCICCLRLHVHAWIQPRIKPMFFFVFFFFHDFFFLILLRSLRVYRLRPCLHGVGDPGLVG